MRPLHACWASSAQHAACKDADVCADAGDFVALKLDIDNPGLETAMMAAIEADPELIEAIGVGTSAQQGIAACLMT
jgi:hypothetical protein